MIFFLFNQNMRAQCIDSIESAVDCCVKVEIFCGLTSLGYIKDVNGNVFTPCGGDCFIPLATTSAPVTQAISFFDANCLAGADTSLTSYCGANPSCNVNFKIVNSAPANQAVPSSGILDFNLNSACCGMSFHAEIVGNKLKIWYDCP